jgi:hypothetical protein
MSDNQTSEVSKPEPVVVLKERKTFKQYYEDPAFKTKHQNYVKEKVACPVCARSVARYNMSNHKKTKKCQSSGANKKTDKEKQFEAALTLAMKMVLEKKIPETFK